MLRKASMRLQDDAQGFNEASGCLARLREAFRMLRKASMRLQDAAQGFMEASWRLPYGNSRMEASICGLPYGGLHMGAPVWKPPYGNSRMEASIWELPYGGEARTPH